MFTRVSFIVKLGIICWLIIYLPTNDTYDLLYSYTCVYKYIHTRTLCLSCACTQLVLSIWDALYSPEGSSIHTPLCIYKKPHPSLLTRYSLRSQTNSPCLDRLPGLVAVPLYSVIEILISPLQPYFPMFVY